MEPQRTFVPMIVATAVAIACGATLFASTFSGEAEKPTASITMITASVVGQAGATASPSLK